MTTHAYLWMGAEFDGLAVADRVKHHYLSHRDEAGPMLTGVAEHFDSKLHATRATPRAAPATCSPATP